MDNGAAFFVREISPSVVVSWYPTPWIKDQDEIWGELKIFDCFAISITPHIF
jgi:hypothetical protein